MRMGMLLLLAAASAQGAPYRLGEVAVVDPEAGVVYVADGDGLLEARRLADGNRLWHTPAPGLPLARVSVGLVAQGVPSRAGRLRLLLLDPQTGERQLEMLGVLPEEVQAPVLPVPARSFELDPFADAEGLRLLWRYAARPLRGAVLDEVSANAWLDLEGGFTVSLTEGTAIALETLPDELRRPAPDLGPDERIPGLAGDQMRSADGGHAMVAAAVADDSFGVVHRLRVVERASGTEVATLVSPYAALPFAVLDGQVLVVSPPVLARLPDGSVQAHGARLVAYSARGEERWSAAVLDRRYRGPLPP